MTGLTGEMMDLAKVMAKRAGRALVEYRGHVAGRLKGFRDFVSEADLAAESIILETIRSAYPGHSVLSEEAGDTMVPASEYCWIIDPLDGTKNYLWGIPLCNVSIALAHQGNVELGVVYDPWRDEMFWGMRGKGVFLNDRPVRVTEHERLSDSLVATDFSFAHERAEMALALSRSLQTEVAGTRAFGCAALDMAYVACGRLDAYFNYGLHIWDMAAGGFLISEAGGRTTTLDGKEDYLRSRGCLATNGRIHAAILDIWHREGVFDLPQRLSSP